MAYAHAGVVKGTLGLTDMRPVYTADSCRSNWWRETLRFAHEQEIGRRVIMANRKAIKGAIRNFVETYTSRYSDFDGYWLFGFIVDGLQQLSIDLLNPACDHSVATPEYVAVHLAAAKFRDQIEKTRLSISCVCEAKLLITKSQDGKMGLVNGHSCFGHNVDFLATAISDHGKKFEYRKSVFVTQHNPHVELQSTRGTYR